MTTMQDQAKYMWSFQSHAFSSSIGY